MGDCTLVEIDPILYLTECGEYLDVVTNECCGVKNVTTKAVGNASVTNIIINTIPL